MKGEPPPLAERRVELIARIAAQRRALGAEVEPWRRPLTIADRGIAVARLVKGHPAWVVGGLVAPRLLRNSRLGAWLGGGLLVWEIVRRLRDRRSSF